jgi:phage shock protein A
LDPQRDIGRLEAKVEQLEKTVEQMDEKLDQLMAYMSEARGSWKTVMALGGFAAAVGSGITWVVTHLWPR